MHRIGGKNGRMVYLNKIDFVIIEKQTLKKDLWYFFYVSHNDGSCPSTILTIQEKHLVPVLANCEKKHEQLTFKNKLKNTQDVIIWFVDQKNLRNIIQSKKSFTKDLSVLLVHFIYF
jgi:hypothetical protein